MEQVIKFRALKDDMSNCIFMYGQLVYDAIGQPRITEIDSSGKGLTFHTCLKGTECQFTGLLDKHGKEIYCGDLVKHEAWNYPFEVVFDQQKARFVCKLKGGLTQYIANDKLEIIGNIHQNSK